MRRRHSYPIAPMMVSAKSPGKGPLSAVTNPVARRAMIVRLLRWIEPAVRRCAAVWRRTVARRTRVVAVVGSYGKTTTARTLSSALCGEVHPYLANNAGFFVSHAIFRIRPGQPHQVIEVGISAPGQMARHASTVKPDVVVVTSIGTEHGRSLGTLEVTRAEKARMVEGLRPGGTAFLCGDDPNVLWMRGQTKERVITFGLGPHNDYWACDVRSHGRDGTTFTVEHADHGRLEVETPLVGAPGLRAALAALAVGLDEGLNPTQLLSSIRAMTPTVGRLEPQPLPSGATLLRDEYKSSLETVEMALAVLGSIEAERRICVLGEISEPPGSQGAVYRAIGRQLAEVADRAYILGGNFQRYAAGAKRAGMDPESLIDCGRDVLGTLERLREDIGPGDLILVKGRDTERLDRISLGLLGADVRCALTYCDAKAYRCHHCPMLERSW